MTEAAFVALFCSVSVGAFAYLGGSYQGLRMAQKDRDELKVLEARTANERRFDRIMESHAQDLTNKRMKEKRTLVDLVTAVKAAAEKQGTFVQVLHAESKAVHARLDKLEATLRALLEMAAQSNASARPATTLPEQEGTPS